MKRGENTLMFHLLMEPLRTRLNRHVQVRTRWMTNWLVFPWLNTFKPVQTRLHLFVVVRLLNRAMVQMTVRTEQVRTSANRNEQLREQVAVVQQLQARIEDLKSEVEFYRDELKDRRHTTLALTDVIEAFRLTAATNASKAQERSERRSHDIRPNGQGDSWSSENTGDDVY